MTPLAEEANCSVVDGTFPCDVHKMAVVETYDGMPMFNKMPYYIYVGSSGNSRNDKTVVSTNSSSDDPYPEYTDMSALVSSVQYCCVVVAGAASRYWS